MRGKAVDLLEILTLMGITPAYAGKSVQNFADWRAWKDHPRLCGEKRLAYSALFVPVRITPAYAGKRVKNGIIIIYL